MTRRKLAAVFLAALVLGSGTPVATAAQDLDAAARQRLYYRVKPAVVLVWFSAQAEIVIQTDRGPVQMQSQMSGGGSGWLISSDGYLVTNGHVVELYHANNEDQLKGQLFYMGLERNYFPSLEQQRGRALTQEEKFQLFRQLYPRTQIALSKNLDVFLQNWRKLPAEVKEYSPPLSPVPGKLSLPWMETQTGKDVAILKIEGRDLPAVRVGDSERVQIGDNVHVAGYPGVVMSHPYLNPQSVLEASFTRGQVSALRLDIKGSNVLQMDAATIWGNSGGPVFADGGEVIGMATFGSIAEGSGGPQAIQGFNFAVPASVVREFMRSAGVVTEPSVFDRTWDRALSLYYAGNHRAAIGAFDEVLRLMPDLPDAIKLRRESIVMVDQGQGGGGLPWLVLGVIGGGVLLVALGLVMRRGRNAPGTPGVVRAAPRPVGRLVVRSGPLQGNQFPVPLTGIKIGRDPDSCQVVLSESTVSREHAVLLLAGSNGDVMIRTLSGTNPTFLNERPIQEATLKSGDQIKIGNSILSYENG